MLASGSLLAAVEAGAVERLISVSRSLGFRLTAIGEVTAETGRFRERGNGVERELPLYDSDEVARALGGSAPL
jgi:hydrogenase maturation factor